MGIEELADTRSTRRTRSSTKVQTPPPVTPPTPKRQPSTPSSSRRTKKKKSDEKIQEEAETNENDVIADVSPKNAPPMKRQKIAETSQEEELKEGQVSAASKKETKIDEVDTARSQESNGSVKKMNVEERVDKFSSPTSKEESQEKKLANTTIPEESSLKSSTQTSAVESESKIKSIGETVVKETISTEKEESVGVMEVDSARSTSKKPAVNATAVKASQLEIGTSDPDHKASVTETKREEQISSSSTKTAISEIEGNEDQFSKTPSESIVDPVSDIAKEVQDEQTQVFEISLEDPSVVTDRHAAEVTDSKAFETLSTENITEQSKIEATQGEVATKASYYIRFYDMHNLLTDEPLSAPVETEAPQ